MFDTYKAALMADWRKDEGIQRLALPEIQLGNISLPSARDVARRAQSGARRVSGEGAARRARSARRRARYWGDGPTPGNAAEFLDERDKIYDPANNPTDTSARTRSRTRRRRCVLPPGQSARVRPGLERMGADGQWRLRTR